MWKFDKGKILSGLSGKTRHLRSLELDDVLNESRSLRNRIGSITLIVGIVVLTSIVLQHVLVGNQTPSPADQAANAFVFGNTSFGSVMVDDQRVSSQHLPIPFYVGKGVHHIVFDAAPFPRQQCILTVPQGSDHDTCHGPEGARPSSLQMAPLTIAGKMIHAEFVVYFTLSWHELPSRLQNHVLISLNDAIQSNMSTLHATVRPGERYATQITAQGRIGAAQATERLQAIPTLGLVQAKQTDACSDVVCPYTPAPSYLAHAQYDTSRFWYIAVPSRPGWHFIASSGAEVSVTMPIPPSGSEYELPAAVSFSDSNGANISFSFAVPGGGDFERQISLAFCTTAGALVSTLAPNIITTDFAPRGIEGCKISILDAHNAGNSNAAKVDGSILVHFGVLLAADPNTHKLIPELPLATSAELAALSG